MCPPCFTISLLCYSLPFIFDLVTTLHNYFFYWCLCLVHFWNQIILQWFSIIQKRKPKAKTRQREDSRLRFWQENNQIEARNDYQNSWKGNRPFSGKKVGNGIIFVKLIQMSDKQQNLSHLILVFLHFFSPNGQRSLPSVLDYLLLW